MSADEVKMVKVTIDDQEIEVEAGIPLIEAARRAGKDIPHFCYHSHLSVAANCRMCAVEVEGARGLPMSCATPCNEGMVARTDTEKIQEHRKWVMEFLLVNHPIDCPICDQAGECKLQTYYMDHDLQKSRLEVDKVEYGKRIPVGPRVVLDQERCVECTRCIRFCDEVTETGELRMANRGDRSVITTFPGKPLENDYSVNTADICPVGALTQKDFRFTARVWFLKEVETICPGCSKGCNVVVDYGHHPIVRDYEGKAYRLRPRVNDEVNRAWMCDFGRTEYHRVNDDRVTVSRFEGEERRFARVAEFAREGLLLAKKRLVIGSLEDTLEEMMALKMIAADLLDGAEVVAVADRPAGKSDDFLLEADKHPNRKGAEWMEMLRDPAELLELLVDCEAVLIHRVNVLAFDADGKLREALAKVGVRVVVSATLDATTEVATHLLPGCSFVEKNGHWVNSQGRVQRIRRGRHMAFPAGARDDLESLAAIADGLVPAEPRPLFERAAREIGPLAGLQWSSAGALGIKPDAERQEAGA